MCHPITGARRSVMIRDELVNLTVPTLYLWGTEDNFVRPDKVRTAFEHAAAITFRTVEDGGHLLTFEAPDLVASATTEFLQSRV